MNARNTPTAAEIRQPWVDHAKGIGIVLVVFGHVLDGVRAAGMALDPDFFQVTWNAIYAFHIPLFFMLSGLFFPQSWRHRGLVGVMANKVDTLIYPYVLWSLLQGFMQVALSHYVNNAVTAGQVLSLLWLPRQEFWFLYALFFTYLFACLAYLTVPERWRRLLLLAALALYFFRTDVPRAAALWYPACYLVYFLVGAQLAGAITRLMAHPWRSLICGAALLILAEWILHQLASHQWDPRVSAVNLLAASGGIVATVALSALLTRAGWRWTRYCGRYSLQIYLLHTIAAAFLRIALQRLLHVQDAGLQLLAGTVFGVAAPLAVVFLLERWQIQGVFSPPDRWQLQRRLAAA